jgi:hypothetical protein
VSASGVSGSASAAAYLSSPAVRLAQLQGSAMSSLFGPSTGEPSNNLVSFTATAAASRLFRQPGLLTGLTQWDGSMTPGSRRTAAAATPTPTPTPTPATPKSPFTFNPFDRASWDVDSKGSRLDLTA